MKNAIILCSGGIDSVVTAYYAKYNLNYNKLLILFFDYGQRASKAEERAARYFASCLKTKFLKIKLGKTKQIYGNLTNSRKVRRVYRKDLKDTKKESISWYFPSRNLIFLSYALSLAESLFLKNKENYDIFVGFKNEGKESHM